MNNGVFGETMEILTKYTDIKFVTTEVRRDYLASELNYHTTTFFSENILAMEMKKPLKYTWMDLSIWDWQY